MPADLALTVRDGDGEQTSGEAQLRPTSSEVLARVSEPGEGAEPFRAEEVDSQAVHMQEAVSK